MQISSYELDLIKARAKIEGTLEYLTGFRIGIEQVQKLTDSIELVDLLEAIDNSMKEIKAEGAKL